MSEANTLLGKELDAKESSKEDTVVLVTEVFATHERESAAVVKGAGLTSKLSLVRKLLGKERNATVMAVMADGTVLSEISALHVETRAAQQAAKEHTAFLESELCTAMEREEVLDEMAACLASELSLVRKQLGEERGTC